MVAMIIFMSCVFHHNDKHGNKKNPNVLKRNINSDRDWLAGNTELASERERTAFSTLHIGSLGGSEVTRVFAGLVELAGNLPSKLLMTAVHMGFSQLGHLPIT